jgi:hypothetical protein
LDGAHAKPFELVHLEKATILRRLIVQVAAVFFKEAQIMKIMRSHCGIRAAMQRSKAAP